MMKIITLTILLAVTLITGCGGKHGKQATTYPPVPATACGVATVAATALSTGVRFIDPVNVSSAGGLSEHPSVATGGGGKVYIAWDDDKNLDKSIFFRRSDDYGSTYQPAANVSNTGSASVPALGVTNNGTVLVAWQDVSTGPSEIRYARSIDGGANFLSSVQVSSPNVPGDTSTQASGVSLAVDSRTVGTGAGNVYLAWSEINIQNATFILRIARSTDNGASFSIVYTYTPSSASAYPVALTVDADGNLLVSWSESSFGLIVGTIRYAKYTDAGAILSAPVVLATGDNLASPTIATDPTDSNRVYVAWRNEDDKYTHFAVSSDNGNSFGPESSIVAGANTRSISARLAAGPDGTIYLSWTDNRGGNYDTYYSESTDHGATFTTPVNFSPSAQGSLFTAIAVDAESNVYIAWDDNRYSNPPGTAEEIANEGNFEILVARGKQGLPAVQAALASPCPVTPNGDSNADTTTITATFSELLTWALDIVAPDGSTVFHQTGSGTSINTEWDGRNNGTVVADGLYTYSVTGSNTNGLVATAASGYLDLYTTSVDAVPEIVVTQSTDAYGNTVQTSTFQREAFGFSPNGDGFKDSNGISAQFNKPVNWAIQIKDSGGAAVRTLTGSGITLDSNVTRWDGKDDAGNILPEGDYIVNITITDGQGLSASCGRQPVPCLIMEIDTTPPDVPDAAVDQITYDPSGGALTISGTPTELSLITIYVYNQTDVLVRKVDRNFRDANVTFNVFWDGKDSNGQTVTPGNYLVYVWCRDRAGNTAVTYPRRLEFTVQ